MARSCSPGRGNGRLAEAYTSAEPAARLHVPLQRAERMAEEYPSARHAARGPSTLAEKCDDGLAGVRSSTRPSPAHCRKGSADMAELYALAEVLDPGDM